MEKIIKDMLDEMKNQEKNDNYEVADILQDFAMQIVSELALTINCPSNWRDICTKLANDENYSYICDWEYGYY